MSKTKIAAFLTNIRSHNVKKISIKIHDMGCSQSGWSVRIDWRRIGKLLDTPQFIQLEQFWIHWELSENHSYLRSRLEEFLDNGPIRQLRHRRILYYNISIAPYSDAE